MARARKATEAKAAPKRKQAELPDDEAGLLAVMAKHEAGYKAYVKARGAGDKAAQEKKHPAYAAYKRAYTRFLKLGYRRRR